MRRGVLFLLPLLAGCGARREAVPIAVTPPRIVAPAPAELPPGATPGMRIPAVLADGSYPTPNRGLTAAATVWHLRAGLNVAALSCPGAQGAGIIAAYNALLAREKAGLAAAEKRYADEFRTGGGDWRDRYDDAMTRLYNFFAQVPARPGLCAAAERTLAAAVAVPAGGLDGFATGELAGLDRPFTDFYRAYDAWRVGSLRMAAVPVAAPVETVARPVAAAVAPATPVPVAPARRKALELDPSVFGTPEAE